MPKQEVIQWTITIEKNLNGRFSANIHGEWVISPLPSAAQWMNLNQIVGDKFITLEEASEAANLALDKSEEQIRNKVFIPIAKETRSLYA